MASSQVLVVRPIRAGYVTGGIFPFLALILVALTASIRAIHGVEDAVIAAVIVGGVTLLGINEFLTAAVPNIPVEDEMVSVRNRLGRHRRLKRSEVGSAAKPSIYTPLPYVSLRPTSFLLVGRDGRCLVRVAESDYKEEDLDRLVTTLGLARPHTYSLIVRRMNRKFPGAYAFDFQSVAIAIMVILTLALALTAIAVGCG